MVYKLVCHGRISSSFVRAIMKRISMNSLPVNLSFGRMSNSKAGAPMVEGLSKKFLGLKIKLYFHISTFLDGEF